MQIGSKSFSISPRSTALEDIVKSVDSGAIKSDKFIKASGGGAQKVYSSGIKGAVLNFFAKRGFEFAQKRQDVSRGSGALIVQRELDKMFGEGIGKRAMESLAKREYTDQTGKKGSDFSKGIMVGDLQALLNVARNIVSGDRIKLEQAQRGPNYDPMKIDLPQPGKLQIEENIEPETNSTDVLPDFSETDGNVDFILNNWQPKNDTTTVDDETLARMLSEIPEKQPEEIKTSDLSPSEHLNEILNSMPQIIEGDENSLDRVMDKIGAMSTEHSPSIPPEDLDVSDIELDNLLHNLESDSANDIREHEITDELWDIIYDKKPETQDSKPPKLNEAAFYRTIDTFKPEELDNPQFLDNLMNEVFDKDK